MEVRLDSNDCTSMVTKDCCKGQTSDNTFHLDNNGRLLCNGWCVEMNHSECNILSMDEIKKSFAEKVATQIGRIERQNTTDNFVLKVLEKRRQFLREEIKKIYFDMDASVKRFISLGSCLRDFHHWTSNISQFEKPLRNLKSSLLDSQNNLNLSEATFNLDEISAQVRRSLGKITLSRESVNHLTINDLRNLCESTAVYASRCRQRIPQYGKVVVKGDQIWIHCFQRRQPEDAHILLSFRDLLLKFNKSSKLPKRAFLQLGDESSVSGDVVIASTSLTPRALDFLLLCSGVKRRSYEGFKLYNPDWVDAIGISNDADEGGSVVKGIMDGGVYEAPRMKGSVEGFLVEESKTSSGFSIIMKDDERWTMTRKFGFVEDGLDVLESLAEGCHGYFIKRCGLII